MRAIVLLSVVIIVALFGIAAEPPKPATFEMRLVLTAASPDSEELTCTHPGTAPGQKVDEKLHVQKKPLLNRSTIKSAAVQKSAASGVPEIAITFTEQGSKRFAEVTRDHVGHRLAIVVDGKVYSAPRIMMEIPGGKAVISGSFTEEEATQLAARLSAGAAK
jgi:preprotein translocase subunit SecD